MNDQQRKDPRYQIGWEPPYGEDYDNEEHMNTCNPDFAEMFGDISLDDFWKTTDSLLNGIEEYSSEQKTLNACNN